MTEQTRRWMLGTTAVLLLVGVGAANENIAANNAAIEMRMLEDVKFLAADVQEGRGIETKGIHKAADYIRDQFRKAGLQSGVSDGSYLQKFSHAVSSKVDPSKTSLLLEGAGGKKLALALGKDYQPISYGGSGKFDGPIVFVGYGITAEDLKYDDYAGVDVAGKVVLMIRKEPQQGDAKSKFNGTDNSDYAGLIPKLENAWVHKAAAVLLVNDPFSTKKPEDDKLMAADAVGFRGTVGIPFIHITQAVANQILEGSTVGSVKQAESTIDRDLKTISQPIDGWSIKGAATFDRVNVELANVVGVLPGEGPSAKETIVVGAHYDHLGFGGDGSLAPKSKEIHNGADDNASGTAALLELVRNFTAEGKKPSRRIVFIAFSGEEKGLLGSRHYVKKDPLYPLADTIAMVNFDMVGRMKEGKLILYGVKTAKEFAPMIDALEKKYEVKLKRVGTGAGPSDHASFYAVNIPAFHFFTDMHKDYHRPSDDVDKINFPGMRVVVSFAADLINDLLALPQRPSFVKVGNDDPHAGLDLPKTSSMAYLGTSPDYGAEVQGVLLTDVAADSPAEKGGIKPGDLIVDIANMPIRDVTGLTVALRKHKAGQVVDVTVERDKKKLTFKVTLGKRGG